MKTKFRRKLFLCFVIIFLIFTTGIIVFEQTREKKYKTDALVEKLDTYTNIIDATLLNNSNNLQIVDSLLYMLPSNVRVTIIDNNGHVLYDNSILDVASMENHSTRPEIILANDNGAGNSIRISSSNETEYLYHARRFRQYYIRIALPYDIQVLHFLKTDPTFMYYVVALFIVTLFIINYALGRFGTSIRRLKNFTDAAENNTIDKQTVDFPNDELGEIGKKIAQNYQRLKDSEKEIAMEREKLLQHVHCSEEGLCFFSSEKTVEFYNGLFIQYLNMIIDGVGSNPVALFTDHAFEKITTFLSTREKQNTYFETKLLKQGKTFAIHVNVFDNSGFEIIINDITRQEKTRLLKHEMTGNITHELRTPVTGIRGCLETVLEQKLSPEKERHFIQSAYNKVLALSELIQDMSLITKIEAAPNSFRLESIVIDNLLDKLKKDLEFPLQEKNIRMEWSVAETVIVKGNKNLLYSIFRNLTDNVIRYAGNDVNIFISWYNEDKDFYYFSYADTGIGISDEQHLNRLFERFYRINEGRTRDTGGSGLGLSIVKNAILFHKGSIVAKNRGGGGLEFLFKLPKGRLNETLEN